MDFPFSLQKVRKGLYQSNRITVKFFLLGDLNGKDFQKMLTHRGLAQVL